MVYLGHVMYFLTATAIKNLIWLVSDYITRLSWPSHKICNVKYAMMQFGTIHVPKQLVMVYLCHVMLCLTATAIKKLIWLVSGMIEKSDGQEFTWWSRNTKVAIIVKICFLEHGKKLFISHWGPPYSFQCLYQTWWEKSDGQELAWWSGHTKVAIIVKLGFWEHGEKLFISHLGPPYNIQCCFTL